jgi:hypothetical protein
VIENPFWKLVEPHVTPPNNNYEGPQIGDWRSGGGDVWMQAWALRKEWARLYSWSVPDPDSIAFVVKNSNGAILDPMAGSGYWEYVLMQSGVDCVAFDRHPPQSSSGDNQWHEGVEQHVRVRQREAAESAAMCEPERTLFLSWPPMDSGAYEAVKAYRGNRVIYIGEGNGGCTADENFFTLIETSWKQTALHKIAQWSGIHDFITVFDRIQTVAKT